MKIDILWKFKFNENWNFMEIEILLKMKFYVNFEFSVYSFGTGPRKLYWCDRIISKSNKCHNADFITLAETVLSAELGLVVNFDLRYEKLWWSML